jgi:hypothetical protein
VRNGTASCPGRASARPGTQSDSQQATASPPARASSPASPISRARTRGIG